MRYDLILSESQWCKISEDLNDMNPLRSLYHGGELTDYRLSDISKLNYELFFADETQKTQFIMKYL